MYHIRYPRQLLKMYKYDTGVLRKCRLLSWIVAEMAIDDAYPVSVENSY